MPVSKSLSRSRAGPTALDLCISAPSISPETDNAAVLALFSLHKELSSLPVVEHRRPFGLINRHLFLSQMSRPFYRELYDKKSCIAFMDKSPLIIDHAATLGAVAEQTVITGDKSLSDGFIITRDGEYLGIGLGLDLVKMVSDVHEQQHQQIVQSIEYASVIQGAMLATSRQAMTLALNDWSLLWQPRDTVGGDYYYFIQRENGWLMVLVDCTGHGVPGAFMTLIFASALNQALSQHGSERPELLLSAINRHIKETLGQIQQEGQPRPLSNDGCDVMILALDTLSSTLKWVSARIPAFILSAEQGHTQALSVDRMGVGYTDTPYDYVWPCEQLAINPQDIFFTMTDGLTDQVGGERGIMFGKRRLRDLLQRYQTLPMPELAKSLMAEWQLYQGEEPRRDDVTFWGFRY
ncbi:MAG: SpoIIE family protein phosphatase [Rouxiella aceris]|uniref:SpoIIE family protein phosphatase n=1 Tax=Rouxiella aceris TaxID=2703884 RepID=UPI00284F8537|nr:SpoIIE family protein phosphatase [Rouxiella aceris]MDR3434003.1 SpoIIE family protein phosphatase [Rouxiella aceris]